MRKIAAAAVAIPFLAFLTATSLIRRISPRSLLRAGSPQVIVMVGAVLMLVTGLLIGLPAKQVAGLAAPTFAPLAPQADAQRSQGDLPLDVPFQVQFTKPMNEASVEGALTITPQINVKYEWDATAQVLALRPDPHWAPHTAYTVDVTGAASDQEGLGLATEIHTSFQSGSLTAGTLVATEVNGGLASPATAFQLTFTRPVKISTVITRLSILPIVQVDVEGDDPTDMASQVFTITPKAQLASTTSYTVALDDGGTDAAGSPLQPVAAIKISTMTAPEVVRFRPQDGTATYDTNQPVSVRFTTAMDEKSTAAAFSVTVGGKAVAGSTYWAEDDTVLVLTPRYSFKVGSTVIARVSTAARAAGGLHLATAYSAKFTVSKPTATTLSYGSASSRTSPYYGSEVYYLALMNCTRQGGWVTGSGACSTETHHTLPAQGRLALNATISNKVSRPYAQYMAQRRILDHYAYHDPHWRLCNWGGFCGASWGENIASPTSSGKGGMIDIEIFYQNEYWCRCEHYYNIMNPYFHQAGIGVWVENGVVRVSIDFYG